MQCFTSVPPVERCLGLGKFMQAINELLRAEESGAAFPIPLDFLQLANCSPNAAELLLQGPKSLLEELEMAIIREQEDASKRSAADSALTVKELVRPRLEGKKVSHWIKHRIAGQDARTSCRKPNTPASSLRKSMWELISKPSQGRSLCTSALMSIMPCKMLYSKHQINSISIKRAGLHALASAGISPSLGDLRAAHIGRLVIIYSTIIRTGAVKVLETVRYFECSKCGHQCVLHPANNQALSQLCQTDCCACQM